MEFELPQEFFLRSEVCAIQLFGRNLLESIHLPRSFLRIDLPRIHG
jgi:hypothetical protein